MTSGDLVPWHCGVLPGLGFLIRNIWKLLSSGLGGSRSNTLVGSYHCLGRANEARILEDTA